MQICEFEIRLRRVRKNTYAKFGVDYLHLKHLRATRFYLIDYVRTFSLRREICQAILEKHSDEYQLGTSRVFLRENLERHLERERAAILNTAAITLQRNVRGFLARTRYSAKRQSAIKLQASVRGWMQRRRYDTLKRGVVKAQATFRGRQQRKRYNQLKVRVPEFRVDIFFDVGL